MVWEISPAVQPIVAIVADVGAIVAGVASLWIALMVAGRRARAKGVLERYLKGEAKKSMSGPDKGLRSLIHVMRQTKLSESQIMDAAFASNTIKLRTRPDAGGYAERVLLGYGRHEGSD